MSLMQVYMLTESLISLNVNILNVLYVVSIIFSILSITSKNPIISIIYLIGLFLNISLYLIVLNLTFLGLSYLIVYVGAVSILFIFILMLINIRLSELQSNNTNNIPISLFIVLLGLIQLIILYPDKVINYINVIDSSNSSIFKIENVYNIYKIIKNELLYVVINSWDGNISDYSHITAVGNIIYSSHNIWIIIVSFILLLTMIGTIIITIKHK